MPIALSRSLITLLSETLNLMRTSISLTTCTSLSTASSASLYFPIRWSFDNPETVYEQLKQSTQLQDMLSVILNLHKDLYDAKTQQNQLVDDIWKEMWLYVSSYESSLGQTVYYIHDQVGCGFLPSYDRLPNDSGIQIESPKYSVPFASCLCHSLDGTSYTAVWPIREIKAEEPLVCWSMNSGLISRLALLKVVDCEPMISPEDYGDLFAGEAEGEKEEREEAETVEGKDIEGGDEDEDMMDPHHLTFPPSMTVSETNDAIKVLSALLSSSAYTVQSITSTLQLTGFDFCLPVWDLSSSKHQPLMRSRVRAHLESTQFSPSSFQSCGLISLFCLGLPLSLSDALELFGVELITSLLKLGILLFQSAPSCLTSSLSLIPTPTSGTVTSVVQIIPTFHLHTQTTLYFMTDFSHHSSHSEPLPTSPVTYETYFEPVMYIGPDSLALFQTIAPSRQDTSGHDSGSGRCGLDVFCGCGVQGITALKINLLDQMTFCEKNHRAVRFLRFNLILNSIATERVKIIHDDVHNIHTHLRQSSSSSSTRTREGEGDDRNADHLFQLILANPPYIPTGISEKASSTSGPDDRGLLGYGAGGGDGEEFIAFVYTDLVRYLSLPSPSTSSGVYLVSNLVNVKSYESKLTRWIQQSTGNDPFLETLQSLRLGWRGYISHDKPWTPQQYAQLILNRNNSQKTISDQTSGCIEVEIEKYTKDLTQAGVSDVCNGIILMQLHVLESSSESSALDTPSVLPPSTLTNAPILIAIEESPEQVWQLLNLSETFKERNRQLSQKLLEYSI
jgi:16S rRNA G966 N2-methylase RsmD